MNTPEAQIGQRSALPQEALAGRRDDEVVSQMLSAVLGRLNADPGGPASLPLSFLSGIPSLDASSVQAPHASYPPQAQVSERSQMGVHEMPLDESLSESFLSELAQGLFGQVPFQPSPFSVSPSPAPGFSSQRVQEDAIRNPGVSVPASPEAPSASGLSTGFDVDLIRRDFPILNETVHGRPLIWLDNAATTQKPRAVIERLVKYYEHENSNVHRGAHTMASRATEAYENARMTVRRFLGAGSVEEVVFTRGTTESINLVAQSWGRAFVGRGDEIVLTTLEHHSNIVPWQFLAKEVGARLRVVPISDRGEVMLDDYEKMLSPRTRLVAFSHVSNALGTVLPARTLVDMAHRHGAVTLVDGAQAVLHFPVDVRALDADFYVFSGHKLLAPTGIGVLYGKRALLEAMPPWQGGGSMIDRVTFETTTFSRVPAKFEAGTGNIGDAVALAAAIDYLDKIGLERAASYERGLLAYATKALAGIQGLRPIGTAAEKAGVLSFVVDWMPSEDMGRYLDTQGIAVRSGHHCAQPALRRFGLSSTVRPSLAFYNTRGEIDALVDAIQRSRVA
jgi:cysteine desulfurase/selenocysteine lyase